MAQEHRNRVVMLDKQGDWAMRLLLLTPKPARPVLWAATVLVLLGLTPAVGRASVIIGNLAAPQNSNQAFSNNAWFAASFTMGSQAYSLSNVQIALTSIQTSTTFTLQSNATGTPAHPSGTDVVTFVHPTFVAGTNTFTPTSPFTLAANTTYWLVGRTGGGSTGWLRQNGFTAPTGSGATFGNYAQGTSSGTVWATSNSNSPIFQVNGTALPAVPEPSSLVLVGTVACVSAAVGWRRRRRARRPEPAVVTAPSADGT